MSSPRSTVRGAPFVVRWRRRRHAPYLAEEPGQGRYPIERRLGHGHEQAIEPRHPAGALGGGEGVAHGLEEEPVLGIDLGEAHVVARQGAREVGADSARPAHAADERHPGGERRGLMRTWTFSQTAS